jgi:hypothetical protein
MAKLKTIFCFLSTETYGYNMATPSEKALEAVQRLKDSGIEAEDIRSAIRLLGGGDFDFNYHQLMRNPKLEKREKEISQILRAMSPDLIQHLKLLTNEIDSSTQEILYLYVPET